LIVVEGRALANAPPDPGLVHEVQRQDGAFSLLCASPFVVDGVLSSAADSLRHPPGSPAVQARPAGVGDSESISRPWWAARPGRVAPHRDHLTLRSGRLADTTAEQHRQ